MTINGETSDEHFYRNSSFELLRILCMFGIVSMHIFGVFYETAQGINQVFGVLINSLFNMGVSIFMLISGYFGINGSVKKYLKLELEVLFYSGINLLIMIAARGDLNLTQMIWSVAPVMSGKYWYITTYMLLMIFSQYINQIAEKLEKIRFEKLLLLMFLVFSLIPTIIRFHVMNDGGKGLMNMLLMYWIGRYIRLYGADQTSNKKIAGIGVGVITLGFVLNMGISTYVGGGGGKCTVCERLLKHNCCRQCSRFSAF